MPGRGKQGKEVKMKKRKLLEPYSREKEEEVQRLWKRLRIAEKARKQSARQKKSYYFMDGPPYATGHIHMGTALNKILKDVAIRAKRMQGFCVFDRPGYDTHGLPIENKVEQQLGFKGKQDIERYSIAKFVAECKRFATQFIGVMNAEFNDLGVWMDWEKPYLTLSDDYIEAIWWTFRKAHEKGLLYEGLYPVHVCPHCATAVAYNEIEYAKQTDLSVYVKFPLADKPDTFLVVWTTTPWTLPGNTGVMVHPEFNYSFVRFSSNETWIIASEKVQGLMDAIEAGFTVEKTVKGKELEGMRYKNPLALHMRLPEMKGAYRVILSERYVNLEEGTGLVHTAPGHGKEDFDAGSKAALPAISPVRLDGTMTLEAGKYAGKKAREVDNEIVADLEAGNELVYKHPYTHDYPLCWRCKSPLLMLSVRQWFFRISAIQKKLLEFNEKTNWVPAFMRERMRDWLQQLGDWPISRARYWGAPLPIWRCERCSKIMVIGSVAELKRQSGLKKIDLHKPGIDAVKLRCSCSGTMQRVPEVLDVWFDSGVSSWAALGFPGKDRLFKRFWPADLNLEGPDQFRGWWNSQLILSTIAFGKKPFETIMVHGLITDLEKVKMSKSRGSAVTPKEVVAKHDRDSLRFYLISNSRGQDIAFDWDAFRDIKRFFNTLWNSCNYTAMYLPLSHGKRLNAKMLQVEDRWLLSKLNSMLQEALSHYNSCEFFKACSVLDSFVLEELSRTYIKLVRDRVGGKSERAVSLTLSTTLLAILRLLAPIAPHFAEYLYQGMRSAKMPRSVHLLQMPAADKKAIDAGLESEMQLCKQLSQAVLALREEQKLRLRWPLRQLVVQSKTGRELRKLRGILAKMCNVEEVKEATAEPEGNYAAREFEGRKLFLDIAASSDRRERWELMELRRRVQQLRKQARLLPAQRAKLLIASDDSAFLQKHRKEIEHSTNTVLSVVKKQALEKLVERCFSVELEK